MIAMPMEPFARPARIAGLAAVLFGFWLLLSGHYTPWLVGAGVLAALAVALAAAAAGAADEEGFPAAWALRAVRYWPWLIAEIAKSALAVARVVLHPKLPMAPRFLTVPASQKTAAGLAVFANSITLTPGTIAVEIDRRPHPEILVHALTEAGAEGMLAGDMDRRVTAAEAG